MFRVGLRDVGLVDDSTDAQKASHCRSEARHMGSAQNWVPFLSLQRRSVRVLLDMLPTDRPCGMLFVV
jgi:hypothetical protein